MALREPQRLLLFALTLLIHVGLYELLASERRAPLATREERHTALVFLRDNSKVAQPVKIAPLAPASLPQPSLLPQISAPQLVAPPASSDVPAAPVIDWQRDAEEVARRHALETPAPAEPAGPKPKPDFAWSHARTRPIEPLENRGDLFEHMDGPATPGDWKDD